MIFKAAVCQTKEQANLVMKYSVLEYQCFSKALPLFCGFKLSYLFLFACLIESSHTPKSEF